MEVVSNFAGLVTNNAFYIFGPNVDIPSEETIVFPDLESNLDWKLGKQGGD